MLTDEIAALMALASKWEAPVTETPGTTPDYDAGRNAGHDECAEDLRAFIEKYGER